MRRRLDALLLLDKPQGLSSNAALQIARRCFSALKAGHGGTLDPMASGLLPVLFGDATKFSSWMLDAGKTYLATLILGVRTDSGDAEGSVIARRPVDVGDSALMQALEGFRGEIEQVPPMHSALKRHGTPLYALARRGIEVPREARRVCIHRLELVRRGAAELEIEVDCSKGTYIRTLADDIGESLGCGAHLAALRRTRVGAFSVYDAWTLDRLEALPEAQRELALLPADRLLAEVGELRLDEAMTARFCHGQSVAAGESGSGLRRIYGASGRFLGVGEVAEAGSVRPLRLVADASQAADNH